MLSSTGCWFIVPSYLSHGYWLSASKKVFDGAHERKVGQRLPKLSLVANVVIKLHHFHLFQRFGEDDLQDESTQQRTKDIHLHDTSLHVFFEQTYMLYNQMNLIRRFSLAVLCMQGVCTTSVIISIKLVLNDASFQRVMTNEQFSRKKEKKKDVLTGVAKYAQ